MGLERTGGFETVAFCEIDEFCRKVLRKHWPDVPIHEDVRSLTGDAVGPVDIITGGFPCQDISDAGEARGIDGERSGLWTEFARLIGEIRPRYAIVENVAALLHRGMGDVLGDLAALRYDAEWDSIPAALVGSRQIRDRVFIVATPGKVDNAHRIDTGCFQGLAPTEGWWATDNPKRPRFGWGTWAREPAVARVAYGIPDRIHRLKSLGNAVVPQIPEIIGRAILEAERN